MYVHGLAKFLRIFFATIPGFDYSGFHEEKLMKSFP